MTELSNIPPETQENPETQEQHSPRRMIFTMLLLIAALLLTSAMMMHYAFDGTPAEGHVSGLKKWFEQKQTVTVRQADTEMQLTPAPAPTTPPPSKTESAPQKNNHAEKVISTSPNTTPEAVVPAAEPSATESALSSVKKFFDRQKEQRENTVRWPKLKVTGFGTSTDIDGSFAIINGQRVLLNHYINGVQLVEIRAHDIVVEYKGERRILADELQK